MASNDKDHDSHKMRQFSDRGRKLLGGAVKSAQSVTGTLTGKGIEQKVSEYSELYTQVLLGIHSDTEEQSRIADEQAKRIEDLEHRIL